MCTCWDYTVERDARGFEHKTGRRWKGLCQEAHCLAIPAPCQCTAHVTCRHTCKLHSIENRCAACHPPQVWQLGKSVTCGKSQTHLSAPAWSGALTDCTRWAAGSTSPGRLQEATAIQHDKVLGNVNWHNSGLAVCFHTRVALSAGARLPACTLGICNHHASQEHGKMLSYCYWTGGD
jgi:hypothetical protein